MASACLSGDATLYLATASHQFTAEAGAEVLRGGSAGGNRNGGAASQAQSHLCLECVVGRACGSLVSCSASSLRAGATSKGEVWRYLKQEICHPRVKN